MASCQQASTSAAAPTSENEPTATTISVTETPIKESTAAPQIDPQVEEYAVYAAILESTFVREDTRQVLIMDHTRTQDLVLMEDFLAITSPVYIPRVTTSVGPLAISGETAVHLKIALVIYECRSTFGLVAGIPSLCVLPPAIPQ